MFYLATLGLTCAAVRSLCRDFNAIRAISYRLRNITLTFLSICVFVFFSNAVVICCENN